VLAKFAHVLHNQFALAELLAWSLRVYDCSTPHPVQVEHHLPSAF